MDRIIRMIINKVMRYGTNAAVDFVADRKKKNASAEDVPEIEASRKQQKQNMKRANQAMRLMRKSRRF